MIVLRKICGALLLSGLHAVVYADVPSMVYPVGVAKTPIYSASAPSSPSVSASSPAPFKPETSSSKQSAQSKEVLAIPGLSVRKNPNGTKTVVSTGSKSSESSDAIEDQPASPVKQKQPVIREAAPSLRPQFDSIATPPASSSLVKGVPSWLSSALQRGAGKTTISVSQGITENLLVARGFPNRFVTPFKKAEVVTTAPEDTVLHKGTGGVAIIAIDGDQPVGVFIQEVGSDRAIPLTLVPADIAPKEYRFQLDDTWEPPTFLTEDDRGNTVSATYVDNIKSIMGSLAVGEIPDGHVLSPLRVELLPNCQMPGLTLTPGQLLEGSNDRVGIYVAKNTTGQSILVQEEGCYRSGVLAVSAYPLPRLDPGQSTEVFVLMRKELTDPRSTSKRRPSLVKTDY